MRYKAFTAHGHKKQEKVHGKQIHNYKIVFNS